MMTRKHTFWSDERNRIVHRVFFKRSRIVPWKLAFFRDFDNAAIAYRFKAKMTAI